MLFSPSSHRLMNKFQEISGCTHRTLSPPFCCIVYSHKYRRAKHCINIFYGIILVNLLIVLHLTADGLFVRNINGSVCVCVWHRTFHVSRHLRCTFIRALDQQLFRLLFFDIFFCYFGKLYGTFIWTINDNDDTSGNNNKNSRDNGAKTAKTMRSQTTKQITTIQEEPLWMAMATFYQQVATPLPLITMPAVWWRWPLMVAVAVCDISYIMTKFLYYIKEMPFRAGRIAFVCIYFVYVIYIRS